MTNTATGAAQPKAARFAGAMFLFINTTGIFSEILVRGLQHGEAPEDFLLAHEFCVVAITKGKNDKDTRWLAAASEDRFLMNIGRLQRFATQFRSEGAGPMKLYPVDPTVTDNLRRLMDARSLAEARAHETELNK